MRDSAGEVGTNSLATYSRGTLHMDEQRQDNQLEPISNSFAPIQDIALKTCQKQWTIGMGGQRGSGISLWHDDDGIYVCVCVCICMCIYVGGEDDSLGIVQNLKFDHNNIWHMHKPDPLRRENEAHKILCDLKIQTDHLISARRPDLVIVKKTKTKKEKRICQQVDFVVKENENRDKSLQENWKNDVEHEGDCDVNCNWCTWNDPQKLEKW